MEPRKNRKRLPALLLSLCLVLVMLPLSGTATASGTVTDVWDGSVASAYAGGDGSAAKPYQIATGAQLAYLREQVGAGNEYDGKHFVLTADLNLNYTRIAPIGRGFRAFSGSLDGAGHSISKFSLSGKQGNDIHYKQGLFSVIRGDYIRNLTISNVNLVDAANASTAYDVGALAGQIYNNTRVENCHVQNIILNVGVYSAGGLAGSVVSDGTQPDLVVKDGGLIGCTAQNITIEPYTSMKAAGNYGGLVGSIAAIKVGDGYTLRNCDATGAITTAQDAGWDGSDWGGIGGLVGAMIGGSYTSDTDVVTIEREYLVRNCHADVAISTPNLGGIGGLFGEASMLTMESCSSSGDVTGNWATGGLVGTGTASELRDCHATGNVTAYDWQVGGLVGYGPKSKLERCFATGDVVVDTAGWPSRAGGLLGNGYGSTVKDCFASGDVTGTTGDVGGLVGWVSNADDSATAGSFTNCFAFGEIMESESDDLEYAKPLINGIWDASNPNHAKVVNCYYNSETSGRKDSQGTDKTVAEFADGTVRGLLGDPFTQLDGAACPTLPIEWSGVPRTLPDGLFYRISKGNDIRLTPTIKHASGLYVEAGAVLDIQGSLTLSAGQQIENHGRILGRLTQIMNDWNSIADNTSTGSIEEVLLTGGTQGHFSNNAGQIGKIAVEGGTFYNYNGGLVKELMVAGGNVVNIMRDPDTMYYELPLKAPVIENATVTAGQLSNYDYANKLIGTPPAIVKKLTADFTQTNVVGISNYNGGLIEEAVLQGGDGTPSLNHGTVFKNSQGGVVNTLSVQGNAGYKIWNGNVSELYGTPIVKELVMDGGYAKFTNYNDARVEKATIEYNNTFAINNRASVGDLIVKQSNVLNNYDGSDDPARACRIDRLFTVSRSSINNWDVGEIGELYVIGEPYVSGINMSPYDAFDAPGKIGKLYYKIDKAADTPAAFIFDDGTNISTVTDCDDYDDPWPGYGTGSFNGVYGEPEKTIPFGVTYTGTGKLTGVRMNGMDLTAGTDGSYSFTMPQENAMLSVTDRALNGDATLSSLTYSVNGGEPVPVPAFTAENGFYSITLPRSTPRDAAITLAGVPANASATIAASADGKLVHGATAYEAPASLTVQAEDGTEKTYEVAVYTEAAQAAMKDAVIGGIEEGNVFRQGQTPAFTASGSGLENTVPAVDDERYRPASWQIDDGAVLSGSWNGAPYSGSLDLSNLAQGNHTLTVTYAWERFGPLTETDAPNGRYGWTVLPPDGPETFTKTVSFTIAPAVYTLSFDPDGGAPVPAAQTLAAGAKPAAVNDPAKDGYTFLGWYDGDTKVDLGTFTMPERSLTLKAGWEQQPAPSDPPETGERIPAAALLPLLAGLGGVIAARRRRGRAR